MKIISILFFIGILLFPVSPSWAGGAVAAIKQRQAQAIQEEYIRQQQQAMVQEYMAAQQQAAVQQYIAQQQAAAVAAFQQRAAAQYVAQQMAQEVAAYRAAVNHRQEILDQQQALRIKVVRDAQYGDLLRSYQAQQYLQQRAVGEAVVAQQQKTMAEYQQALLSKQIGEKAAYEQAQAVMAAKSVQEAQEVMAYQTAQAYQEKNKLYEDIPSSYIKDVVPITELWKSLDKSAKAWPLIIDKKAKGATVSHYIDELAKEGKISQDPGHYVEIIDGMYRSNPQMLLEPFKEVLRIVSIIEYDYDNGVDKDVLARKVFPDEHSYVANKKRLGR